MTEVDELVSIVLPFRNAKITIGETLESVLAQTYQDWEMIAVDDCSTDKSMQIVEQYRGKDSRIRTMGLNRRNGVARARNIAIRAARGRYIAFLDSDDLWFPEKLQRQIDFMQENKLLISYTAYKKIDRKGNIGKRVVHVPEVARYDTLLRSNYIPLLTAVYDTARLGKRYMLELPRFQHDYVFWLTLMGEMAGVSPGPSAPGPSHRRLGKQENGILGKGINDCLALYRIRANSLSSNKIKAAGFHWRVLREVAKLSFLDSVFCFVTYAYHGSKKWITF